MIWCSITIQQSHLELYGQRRTVQLLFNSHTYNYMVVESHCSITIQQSHL